MGDRVARNRLDTTDPDGGRTTYAYLCPCQLTVADFRAALFRSGIEMRVGGPGGGASSPWSPPWRRRNPRMDAWHVVGLLDASSWSPAGVFLLPRGTTCTLAS